MKTNKLIICLLIVAMLAACAKPNEAKNNDLKSMETEPYGKFTTSGKLVKINDDGFHIQTGDNVNVYTVDTGKTSNFYIGEYVRLNSLDGKMYNVALDDGYDYNSPMEGSIFDEASKISVKVKEILRDELGRMKIYGVAADNREYHIIADADTITNFSYSKLKADDDVFIYPSNITSDIPALVNAKAIVMKNRS